MVAVAGDAAEQQAHFGQIRQAGIVGIRAASGLQGRQAAVQLLHGGLHPIPGGLLEQPKANRCQGRHQGRANPHGIKIGGRRPIDGQPIVDGFRLIHQLQHHVLTGVVLAEGAAQHQGEDETGGPQQRARQGVKFP